MSGAGRWRQAWPALLVVLAWLPALGASFQFDDFTVIVADPHVQSRRAQAVASAMLQRNEKERSDAYGWRDRGGDDG